MSSSAPKTVPRAPMSSLRYFLAARTNAIALRTRLLRECGPCAQIQLGSQNIIWMFHPDFARDMLGAKEQHFMRRNAILVNAFEPIAGRDVGLLSTNNLARWRKDRAVATMALDEKVHFQAYARTIASRTGEHLEGWRTRYHNGQYIDIEGQINSMVLDMVLNTLFTNLTIETDELLVAITDVVDAISNRLRALNRLAWRLPTKRKLRYDELLASTTDRAAREVRQRMKAGADFDDMLGNFVHHTRDADRAKLVRELNYHFMSLIGVSFFTTSALVHWSLIVMSRFPDIERRLAAEVEAKLGDRPPRLDDLKELTYMNAFMKEVLRLHPSALSVNREAAVDAELNGYLIPKGANAFISIFHIHRDPEFWTNPEGFDPQRFLDKPLGQDNPYAYIPFGGGQRACIGRSFAFMEATIMLVMLIQRVRLELPAHAEIGYKYLTILTMRPDVSRMRLTFKN